MGYSKYACLRVHMPSGIRKVQRWRQEPRHIIATRPLDFSAKKLITNHTVAVITPVEQSESAASLLLLTV